MSKMKFEVTGKPHGTDAVKHIIFAANRVAAWDKYLRAYSKHEPVKVQIEPALSQPIEGEKQ
ncbi:hypothetical protein [uncultured Roseobacter sp.]|uniref:hypothetical protein n=1 Tax=uncultured Roseobacter sp. TaxID=114847 RepID=UPI00262CA55C|nr:hypothetical protein [uncultured Roseobacter sp.]